MAIRLGLKSAPYNLDLGYGVTVEVRPYDGHVDLLAETYLNRKLREIGEEYRRRKDFGESLDGLPDLEDEDSRFALTQHCFAVGRAVAGIISWTGVYDKNDVPAAVTEQAIEDLFTLAPLIRKSFHSQYLGVRELLAAEKNGSGAASDGMPAPETNTAAPAAKRARRAAGDKGAKAVNSARKSKTSPRR